MIHQPAIGPAVLLLQDHGGRPRRPLLSTQPLIASCRDQQRWAGFAGALAEVGLPSAEIPLALLTFNLGVEAGQLAFVAVVAACLWTWRRLIVAPSRWEAGAFAYPIGSLAAFWLIERVTGF